MALNEEERLERSLERNDKKLSDALEKGATREYVESIKDLNRTIEDLLAVYKKEAENSNQARKIFNDKFKETPIEENSEKLLRELTETLRENAKEQAKLREYYDKATDSQQKDRMKKGLDNLELNRKKVFDDFEQNKSKAIIDYSNSLEKEVVEELRRIYEDDSERERIGKEALKLEEEKKKLKEEEIEKTKELNKLQEESDKAVRASNERTEKWMRGLGQLYQGIKGILTEAGQTWMKYNHQAVSDAKTLGITSRAAAHAYATTMMENSKTLMREFGMNQEQVMKMQESYAKVTGRSTILTQEQMRDIAASSQLMGEETVNSAIEIMNRMGTTSEATTELLDKNFARAVNSGVNTVKASEEFVKNMSLANKLSFRNGVDGISKMTILSQRIKLNFQEVASVADKFSTIEGAIEASARLQMLGGAGAMYGGNPLQMMFESLADPEALFQRMGDMFAKQAHFDRKTGESRIDPIQMALTREMAMAAGMNPDEAINSAKHQAAMGDLRAHNRNLYAQIDAFHAGDSQKAEDLKAKIENQATFNKDKQRWEITFDDEFGARHNVGLDELNYQQLQQIEKDRIEPVQDIKNNVRLIAQKLVPLDDTLRSIRDQKNTAFAQVVDPAMKWGDNQIHDLSHSDGWKWLSGGDLTNTGLLMLGQLGLGIGGGFLFDWVKKGFTKGIKTSPKGNPVNGGGGQSTSVRGNPGNNPQTPGGPKNTPRGQIKNPLKGKFSFGQLRKLTNFVNGPGAKVSGAGLSILGGVIYGVNKWGEAEDEKTKTLLKAEGLAAQGRGNQQYIDNIRKSAINKEQRDKGGAIGGGIGTAGGAILGMKFGAMVGSIGGPIGTLIGGAVGGIAGGFYGATLGNKLGSNVAGSNQQKGIIEAEEDKINDSDEAENLRRIVLPIESIDYNVALIANQLGVISAMPAKNNIYLDAEAGGEIAVQTTNIQASQVNPVNGGGGQSTPVTGNVKLDVSGTIELNLKGQNAGKLSAQDIAHLIENNEELKRAIANIVAKKQNQGATAGKEYAESAPVRNNWGHSMA